MLDFVRNLALSPANGGALLSQVEWVQAVLARNPDSPGVAKHALGAIAGALSHGGVCGWLRTHSPPHACPRAGVAQQPPSRPRPPPTLPSLILSPCPSTSTYPVHALLGARPVLASAREYQRHLVSIVPAITATIVRLGRSEVACCAAINILAHIARNDANKADPAMVGGLLHERGAVSGTFSRWRAPSLPVVLLISVSSSRCFRLCYTWLSLHQRHKSCFPAFESPLHKLHKSTWFVIRACQSLRRRADRGSKCILHGSVRAHLQRRCGPRVPVLGVVSGRRLRSNGVAILCTLGNKGACAADIAN